MSNHHIVIDIQVDDNAYVPTEKEITLWANCALNHAKPETKTGNYEVSLCIIDVPTMQELNLQYRQKNKPTNVLSFCTNIPEDISNKLELADELLGDILICADVVNQEAEDQNKSAIAHWAHMVIHGCLHLLGYDHIEDKEAAIMESIETVLIEDLGYPAPYETQQLH